MASVRIGNQEKSVRVKTFVLEFYSRYFQISFPEAKEDAYKLFNNSPLPVGMIDADYIGESLLRMVELDHRP